MELSENYKKSCDLWLESQNSVVGLLKINIQYLEKEILLKIKQLENAKKSLIHETKVVDDFIAENYKKRIPEVSKDKRINVTL